MRSALIGAVALYLFLKRTYIGTAIRAIAQDREIIGLMGVDQRRIYLVTSAIGGALAGLAACLLALQYDVHPFIGNTFGPMIFMICVLGGLGNMIGGFIAAFVISQIIAIGGYYLQHRALLCARFHLLHRPDVHPAAGSARAMSMTTHACLVAGVAILFALPRSCAPYFLHLADPDPALGASSTRLGR